MKNKITAVILVIIMLIPSMVAIGNYIAQQGGAADSHNTVSVTLSLQNGGKEYSFLRENKSDSVMIDYFLSVLDNSETVGALPTTIQIGSFMQCTVATAVKEFAYKFYYTTSPADCYFMDGDGNAYKISETDAEYFLTSPYAGSLYENGSLPLITLSGSSGEISPATAEWYFTDCKGQLVKSDTSPYVKAEAEDVTVAGGLAMSFSVEPDNLTVTVTDSSSGDILFNDTYDKIGSLSIDKTVKVGVEVSAKWYEDAGRTYYGEQSYKFNASVSAPAQFFAGATELEIGEFICVTGVNVTNVDEVSFKSTPSIDYTPVFFADGDYIRALIPFNWDLAAGAYELTFDYGGTSQVINITLKNRTNAFRNNATTTIPDGTVTSYGSDEAKEKCHTTLLEVAKSTEQSAVRYFDGAFGQGIENSTIVGGFGHTFTVKGTNISYRHTGVDYSNNNSVNVSAVNSGVVVYAGFLDYSGYTVVVEHGYGLKSWYCHMSKTSVEVGDKVEKGAAVGVTGNSGFVAAAGAHIGLTVFDVPVCQYALWSDGTFKGVPMYNG